MAERDSGLPESANGSGSPGREVGATSFLQRAVIRRRVRFLRRRRELALHDLGGFLFESHRLAEPREELLAGKLAALTALDGELAALQRALDLREELAVLHEPGIAACPRCDTLHDSAANFCPNCGRPAGEDTLTEDAPGAAFERSAPPPEIHTYTAVETAEMPAPDPDANPDTTADPAPDATAEMPAPHADTSADPAPDLTAEMPALHSDANADTSERDQAGEPSGAADPRP